MSLPLVDVLSFSSVRSHTPFLSTLQIEVRGFTAEAQNALHSQFGFKCETRLPQSVHNL